MLSVNIICIGKLKEKYLTDGVNEYLKRMRPLANVSVIELSEERCKDDPSDSEIKKVLSEEGKRIQGRISKDSYTIAMCIEGKELNSEELSKKIEDISQIKSTVNFIIGGSFGLSDEIKDMADLRLSMGRMTFPHQLSRLMLCEQIYRAFQISRNTKYHK